MVKASGESRVMIDYLAALRPMPVIFQWRFAELNDEQVVRGIGR